MSPRRPFAAAILLALGASPLAAQSGRGGAADSLLRELALAFVAPFAGRSAEAPRLVVGRAPDGLPAGLPIGGSDATVLGGYSAGGRSVVVVRTPNAPGDALAEARRAIAEAGWSPPSRAPGRGGFASSSAAEMSLFCRDTSLVTVLARAREGGGSHLTITATTARRGYSPCSPSESGTRGMFREGPPFPTLEAPPGVTTLSGGSTSGGSNMNEASVHVRTGLALPDLLAPYASKLRAAGWTILGGASGDSSVLVQPVAAKDENGRQWTGLLAVIALGPTERELVLRISAPDEAR